MKKTISFILSLLMIITSVICVDFSALAQEHTHEFYGGMCSDETCRELDKDYNFSFEDMTLNEIKNHIFFNYGDSVAYKIQVEKSGYYQLNDFRSTGILICIGFYDQDLNIVSKKKTVYLEAEKVYYCVIVSHSYNTADEVRFKLVEHEHFISRASKNPTCTTEGYINESCSTCGYSNNEVLPIVDHEFANGKCYYCKMVDESYEKTVTEVQIGQGLDGEISAISEKDYYSLSVDEDCVIILTISNIDNNTKSDIYISANGLGILSYSSYSGKTVTFDAKAGDLFSITYGFSTGNGNTLKGEYSLLFQKHQHNYIERSRTEANCKNTGRIVYDCDTCKKVITETIPVNPDNHNYDVNGSCTVCKRIDPEYKKEYISLGYDNTVSFDMVSSKKYYFYFVTDEEQYYQFEMSADETINYEMFDDSGTKIKNDSSSKSYKVILSLKANTRYEFVVWSSSNTAITVQPVNIHNHNLVKQSTTLATCISDGNEKYRCNDCGYVENKVLPLDSNSHRYCDGVCLDCKSVDETYEIVYKNVTVGQDSIRDVVYCGGHLYYTFTPDETGRYVVRASEYYPGGYNSYSSTFKIFDKDNNALVSHGKLQNGIGGYYDLTENQQYFVEIATNSNAKGSVTVYFFVNKHIHNIVTTGNEATCKDNGKITYDCYLGCDYQETVYSNATGEHDYVKEIVAPTCSSSGYTVYYCSVCGDGYVYDYVAPDGITHNFVDNFCQECGVLDRENCTFPQFEIGDIIDVSVNRDTTYSVLIIPKETDYYNFSSVGAEDSLCNVYNEFGEKIAYNDDYSDSNYNFNFGVKLNKDTAYIFEFGAYSNDTFKVYSSNHIHRYTKNIQKANCGEKGYTAWICSCGEYYFTDIVNPTGNHKYVKGDVIAPTCVDYGYTEYYCSVCYDFYETDKTSPTGIHKYENGYCMYCDAKEEAPLIPASHTVSLNEEIILDFTDRKSVIEFTPDESGTYIIETKGFNDVEAVLENSVGVELDADDDSGASGNIMLIDDLEAGKTYRIVIEMISYDTGDTSLSVISHTHDFAECKEDANCGFESVTLYTCKTCPYATISTIAPTGEHNYENGICTTCGEKDLKYFSKPIKMGDTLTVPKETEMIYEYVSNADGKAIFKSSSIYDPMGVVVDDKGEIIEMGYLNGDNMDFEITFDAVKGKTYYLITDACIGEYEVILTHNHDYYEQIVTPTCTEKGYTAHICKICDDTYIDNEIDALGHDLVKTADAVNPTCFSVGWTEGYKCSRCDYEVRQEEIKMLPHTIKPTTTKATTSADGKIVNKCTVCGKTLSTTAIPRVSSIKLSATSYTYNGKVKTPTVTVKDRTGKTLVKNTDYTVSYASGRKYVGKYAVKITFKGNYSGTKTLYFTIKPKATSISSVSAGSKKFTVKWKKQATQTTGYQIQYSASSNFTSPKYVTVGKNTTLSKTISKLKGGKKYYVRVRTYKTVGSTKYFSSWSTAKSVITKK